MAGDAYKVLGQSLPAAATLTKLYTVPASTKTAAALVVCNQSAIGTSFRVSLRIAGAADATKQYIAYDAAIGGNEVQVLPSSITAVTKNHGGKIMLAATDEVWVYATLATLSFNLLGIEVT